MQEQIVTTLEAGQRLDKYLHRLLPEATTSFLYKMLRKKNITLNGRKAAGGEIVAEKDAIRLFLSDETYVKMGGRLASAGGGQMTAGTEQQKAAAVARPEAAAKRKGSLGSVGKGALNSRGPQEDIRISAWKRAYETLQKRFPQLRILYEDEHIAAAYKPSGVLSQKAKQEDLSLNEWFPGLLLARGEISRETLCRFTPSVQNRLDRNTEGIVLLAKTLPGSHLLTALQREHLLDKYYRMIVAGSVEKGGCIEGYLAKDEKSNTVRLSESLGEGLVYTRTEYRPLSCGQLGKGLPVTRLEAKLITGKTHQLRAHLAGTGHPIVGDPKYGSAAYNRALRPYGIRSQLLLCQRVEFPKDPARLSRFGREDLAGKIISCREPEIYTRVSKKALHDQTGYHAGDAQTAYNRN